ncbi:hypothetical protein [Natronoarchaeum rubrum]|uniref:hypothetical protein n=1 Tax=Natronoarchaeum rubrum TaxID=755311 RepID=UPI0021137173|nr:hypothetical protein [Natronoarchaeum rubrum]
MQSNDRGRAGKRRRAILTTGASALAAGVAGCTGVLSSGDSPGSDDSSDDDGKSFTLPIDGDAETIEYGTSVTATIDGDAPESDAYVGRYHPWTFEAEAGDVVTVSVPTNGDKTVLFLLDADGERVSHNPDLTGSDIPLAGVPLSESGTYVVVVAVGLGAFAPLEYELSVEEGVDEPGDDLRSISIGETKRGEIDLADSFGGEYDLYYEPVRFRGEAGESVTIEMVADDMLPEPALYGPDGDKVAEIDGSGDFSTGRIPDVELPRTGEYTIRARVLGGIGRQEYELTVESA